MFQLMFQIFFSTIGGILSRGILSWIQTCLPPPLPQKPELAPSMLVKDFSLQAHGGNCVNIEVLGVLLTSRAV